MPSSVMTTQAPVSVARTFRVSIATSELVPISTSNCETPTLTSMQPPTLRPVETESLGNHSATYIAWVHDYSEEQAFKVIQETTGDIDALANQVRCLKALDGAGPIMSSVGCVSFRITMFRLLQRRREDDNISNKDTTRPVKE
ncbi:hypothetical protein FAGAP_8807 [Fusarium agapanthi]|uniref:Uncharacterized protein n=1 Tax=Fusarium agapanthi TaxID=1803897 RepID=A0A9P5B3F1_9HYPO|nr:hypothetical protein FAGAP_8807 [Fusarium agapanthi]